MRKTTSPRKPRADGPGRALASTGLYGMVVVGDCMAPLVMDGDTVVCDPSARPTAGDIVVLYYRTASGEVAGAVKRLTMGIDPGVTFPFRAAPDSELMPLVVVEYLSPPKQMAVQCDAILGIHKVIGKRTPEGQVDGALVAANAADWEGRHAPPRRVRSIGGGV